MRFKKITLALGVAILVSGCATWSTSSVDQSNSDLNFVSGPKKAPEEVFVTEGDITDRRYKSIADITVMVNKTTLMHPDPTKEQVIGKLQEKAAELGADAVVHARFGKVGISLLSWGSLEGKGRAVKLEP